MGCLVLCTIFLFGCGRKTLPIPPQDAVPAPIADLVSHQEGNKIVLNWSIPTQTTVGSRLPQIEDFLVFRAVVPEKDYCAGCPVSYTSTIELPLEQAVRGSKDKKASYSETLLRPEHRYIYKVRTKAGWRLISDDSNQISFLWLSPPEAPTDLQAVAGDQQVTLTWQAVRQLVNGTHINDGLRYRVYRGSTIDSLQMVGEPVEKPSYTDTGLFNGRTYYYKVVGELKRGSASIKGLATAVVSARPRDLTPPPPPRNITVVKVAEGIRLLWGRAMASDLAGYKIYRRLPTGKLSLIGQVDVSQGSFVDKNPPVGPTSWYYAITAFDRAHPANESAYSQEVVYESF